MVRASCGVPVTVTASEKVTVRGMGEVVVVPPATPAEELMLKVGGVMSTVKVLAFEFTLTVSPLTWAVAYTVCCP